MPKKQWIPQRVIFKLCSNEGRQEKTCWQDPLLCEILLC
jgi:hypothetical protein